MAFKPQYSVAQINAMVESYDLFGIGYSWGGFESLALPVHPSHLAHVRSVTPVAQQSMVRYQIGLEGVEDLIADLDIELRFLKQDNF